MLGGCWARGGGDVSDDVDGLLCKSLECGVREVEGALGSLTGRGECAVDEREDVLAPGDTARWLRRALNGSPCLLERLERRQGRGERGWGVPRRGDGTDRGRAGRLGIVKAEIVDTVALRGRDGGRCGTPYPIGLERCERGEWWLGSAGRRREGLAKLAEGTGEGLLGRGGRVETACKSGWGCRTGCQAGWLGWCTKCTGRTKATWALG
jgi:hypothetical protein